MPPCRAQADVRACRRNGRQEQYQLCTDVSRRTCARARSGSPSDLCHVSSTSPSRDTATQPTCHQLQHHPAQHASHKNATWSAACLDTEDWVKLLKDKCTPWPSSQGSALKTHHENDDATASPYLHMSNTWPRTRHRHRRGQTATALVSAHRPALMDHANRDLQQSVEPSVVRENPTRLPAVRRRAFLAPRQGIGVNAKAGRNTQKKEVPRSTASHSPTPVAVKNLVVSVPTCQAARGEDPKCSVVLLPRPVNPGPR